MGTQEQTDIAQDVCLGTATKDVRKYILTCTVESCSVSQVPGGEGIGQYSELAPVADSNQLRLAAVDACAVCPRLDNFNASSSMERMPNGLRETSIILPVD